MLLYIFPKHRHGAVSVHFYAKMPDDEIVSSKDDSRECIANPCRQMPTACLRESA